LFSTKPKYQYAMKYPIRTMHKQIENDILWIFPREIGTDYLTNKKIKLIIVVR